MVYVVVCVYVCGSVCAQVCVIKRLSSQFSSVSNICPSHKLFKQMQTNTERDRERER